jgi:uncharacterized protein YndB with AHSA1/START domain
MSTITPSEACTISRAFNAQRNLVFRAFTRASHLRRWWGPAGFVIAVTKFNLCPGGVFHYSLQAPIDHPMGDKRMWGKLIYQEICPPERLVFLNAFSDEAGNFTRHPMSPTWPLQVRNILALTEQEGQTNVSLNSMPYDASDEERNTFAISHPSMQQGFGETFKQLEVHLSALSLTPSTNQGDRNHESHSIPLLQRQL